MSENNVNVQDVAPFKQVPFCEPDTVLTLTGAEFEVIQNILNAFQGPINAVKNVFDRNINEGNIKIKYIQQDGTEITSEEATAALQKAAEIFKEEPQTKA